MADVDATSEAETGLSATGPWIKSQTEALECDHHVSAVDFAETAHEISEENQGKNDTGDDSQPDILSPPRARDRLRQPRSDSESRNTSAESLALLDELMSENVVDTDTYGVSELRDGFFDAIFLKSKPLCSDELLENSKATLPAGFDKHSSFSFRHFAPSQWHLIKSLIRRITATRDGIRLVKSFVAFLVAYILCLVPLVRDWLGRYNYIMVVSVIINHPSRTVGSQLDGAILTSLGTAAGLGWAVVGLLLSTSTLAASAGYGGILAMFLALFMAAAAFVRSFLDRTYQAILCAGIAIIFTTLAETEGERIQWAKLLSYAIPWLLGQAIALVVNLAIFPDAGSHRLTLELRDTFDTMQSALVIPQPRDIRLRRRLARSFVDLSQAYRDLRLDMAVTRIRPDDVGELRNLLQATIRCLLSMETETCLFDEPDSDGQIAITINDPMESRTKLGSGEKANTASRLMSQTETGRLVTSILSQPTREIISCMSEAVRRCDAVLMDLLGHRSSLGPGKDVSSDVVQIQIRMKKSKSAFDAAESNLLDSGVLPASSIHDSAIVQLFVFARHVREAAATIEALVAKVYTMQLTSDDWPRIYLPSYPFWKAIHRTNAQVRHDTGGIAAGSYHVTFAGISRLLATITSREHKPEQSNRGPGMNAKEPAHSPATMDGSGGDGSSSGKDGLRYRIWRILHHLQGFESRYAFKVCLATSLLSVPSYLERNKDWWNHYQAWWAVSLAWIMMHPRVGGNVQDLIVRAVAAISGAIWSGVAYSAGDGNPYVMATFAAIYMLPMLYRFTLSSHPRSGLVGCLSFSVISLSLYSDGGASSPIMLAVQKGISFLVGTTVPVLVNWVLWPFVARHELRYALSSMIFFQSIIYRSTVAKYVYFEEGKAPTAQDIERSEMLEGRLREGFVRIRQLLILTRHELRLRAPFDPLPYSALAESCEHFFEHLIAVRQSALFYNPSYIRDHPAAADRLLSYRRDAVASILGNLYILAGALRSQRPVPKYLPSAIAARKRLLERTTQVSQEMARAANESEIKWHKKWSNIYSYSYNESLTGCMAQLEELEKYTKLIVGEQE